MKYRLKKDLLWAKAGKEFEISEWRGFPIIVSTEVEQPFMLAREHMSDWFEEVDERWKPEPGAYYFFVITALEVEQAGRRLYGYDPVDINRIETGNCFRTKALARMAAEQIKALLKEFHKNNP